VTTTAATDLDKSPAARETLAANALCGIGIFAVVIIATGLPLAYYAARYNVDLDLITRGQA
jgi:hypothetical protein